jgi:RNA polymerase sigma-70 factor (ECF subfamily)
MDDRLLERAKGGDSEALNTLLERHKHLAYTLARGYVREQADAEDIVQEAFIRVFLHIRQFRSESLFSTWLFRIVYCEAMRYLKGKKHHEELAAAEELHDKVEDDHTGEVRKAMNALTAKEAVMVNLFYIGEKSIKEIAAITLESASNIKVILYRARQKMGKQKK